MGLYTKKVKTKREYTTEELLDLLSSNWSLGWNPAMSISKATLGGEYINVPVDALYCLHVTVKRNAVVVKLVNTAAGYGTIIAGELSVGGAVGTVQDAGELANVADANTTGRDRLKAATGEIERILESD